ncbi:glycosyltransferase family 39 protein [Candidatus Micrarchaeota archaeon]|nr:glycosyltransferase family 39 protein [Candidatus Micrarchaeota archaeon]
MTETNVERVTTRERFKAWVQKLRQTVSDQIEPSDPSNLWDRSRFMEHALPSLGILAVIAVLSLSAYIMNSGLPNDFDLYDTAVHAYRLWYFNDFVMEYGSLPLWTSDWYGGMPFLELYPPLALFLFFWLEALFRPEDAIRMALSLTHILGVLFFFFFARRMFHKNVLLTLGASLVYAFFPYTLFEVYPRGALAEATLLMLVPLIFHFYEKARGHPTWRNHAALGLSLGAALLAHFVMGAFLFICVLAVVVFDHARKQGDISKSFWFIVAGGLMATFYIITTIELLPSTVLGTASLPDFTPFDPALLLYKNTHNSLFIGIVGIIGILASFWSVRKDEFGIQKYALLSGAIVLIGWVASWILPPFILTPIQFASRFFVVLSVLFALLIALGFREISNQLAAYLQEQPFASEWTRKTTVLVFALLIVITIVDFSAYLPPGENRDIPLGIQTFNRQIADEPDFYRVDDIHFFRFGFSPAYHHHGAMVGGFAEGAAAYSYLFYSGMYNALTDGTPSMKKSAVNALGFVSQKYAVVDTPVDFPKFRQVECTLDYCIYENEQFQPHLRLVQKVAGATGSIQAIYEGITNDVREGRLDLLDAPIVLSDEALEDYSGQAMLQMQIIEKRPGFVHVRIQGATDQNKGYLVLSDAYYPKWKGYVNGVRTPVYQGIPTVMVLPIDNGDVILKYELGLMGWMAGIMSVLAMMTLIGLLVYGHASKQ